MKRRIAIISLMIVFVLSSIVYAADTKTDRTIKGDYYRQYAATLFDDQKIIVTGEGITMSKDEATGKLVITGAKESLMAADFAVDHDYDFNAGIVGRFNIDGSAAKGQTVVLAFYLDDEEEAFAQAKLVKQRKKGSWEFSKDFNVSVLERKLTGEHRIHFKVVDASSDKVSFALDSFEFCESAGPVVYFNIDESEGTIAEMNSSENHSAECYGAMTVEVPDGYKGEYAKKALKTETYNLEYIRGRGNSTWGTGKNPYKIKLESKGNLLGMGSNKHWVLLANYYDNSLLRNKITYWLGNKLGMDYTPKSVPVDVVMNGEYYGSYFLTEQIRVGKNRVAIDDLEDTPDATDEPTITGGYLLSMGYEGEESKEFFTTDNGQNLLIESPEFEGEKNEAQINYIKNYINDLEKALYGEEFKDKNGRSYTEYLDVDSTAFYYWLQEFSMNGDAYGSGSTYLYKPREGKLHMGPLWDFDYVAWGSTEYGRLNTSGWTQKQSSWNSRLFSDPEFTKLVCDKWPELKAALEELIGKDGQLDKYAEEMEITARYNFEKLGPTPLNYSDDSEETSEESDEDPTAVDLTYDEEIERLRTWIEKRIAWVDSHVDKLNPTETTITFKTADGKTLCTKKGYIGHSLGKLPEAPAIKGKEFLGWKCTQKMTLDEYLDMIGLTREEFIEQLESYGMTREEIEETIAEIEQSGLGDEETIREDSAVRKDMELIAEYINTKDIVYIKKIDTLMDEYNVVYYGEEDWEQTVSIAYDYTPDNTTFADVTIESSDEKVAVCKDGEIYLKGLGSCTLTYKARGGAQKKITLNVYSVEEVEEQDLTYIDIIDIAESNIKMRTGTSKKLQLEMDGDLYEGSSPEFFSTNSEVVSVGETGLLKAGKPGKAVIVCYQDGTISACNVQVTYPPVKKGQTFMHKGLKYKILSVKYKSVKCLGKYKNGKKVKTKHLKKPKKVKFNGRVFNVR